MFFFFISIVFLTVAAVGLYRRLNPQGTLIVIGLLMCVVAMLFGREPVALHSPTGNQVFDLIKLIEETFVSNISRAGLMIMTIGGYVAFMNHIEATHALVRISMKPLAAFKRFPMLAAILTIPIGQALFITTPSATGLGLLLVASFYPILVNLGVSKMTALSMIAATTIFDQGPGSANTALAAELIGINNVEYFITRQLSLVLPTLVVVMITFGVVNIWFDRRSRKQNQTEKKITRRNDCDTSTCFLCIISYPTTFAVGLVFSFCRFNSSCSQAQHNNCHVLFTLRCDGGVSYLCT